MLPWPFLPKPEFGWAWAFSSQNSTWPWYAILTILSSLIPYVLFINLSPFWNYLNYLVHNQKCIPSCIVPVSSGWRDLPISFLRKHQHTYLYSSSYLFGAVPNSTGCSTREAEREGGCCWVSRACNRTLTWSLLTYLNMCLLSNWSLAHYDSLTVLKRSDCCFVIKLKWTKMHS